MKKYILLASVIMALFVVCRCSALFSTNIGDIKNNPRRYADKTVTVSGDVTRTFSLLVIKYFTLRDSTGEITVVTQRPMPKEGEHLTVKGTVRETFSLGSETMLVIMEEPEKTPEKATSTRTPEGRPGIIKCSVELVSIWPDQV